MNTRAKIISGAFIVVVATVALVFFAKNDDTKRAPPVQGDGASNSDPVAVDSACPEFEPMDPSGLGDGWTAYERPDQCYSLAYPEGWAIRETEQYARVRRIENLNATSYTSETAFASIGVGIVRPGDLDSLGNSDGLTAEARKEAKEALEMGKEYCYVIRFNDTPMTTCYRKGRDGNIFSIGYMTNRNLTDLEEVMAIKSTMVLW